jgi:hypothetical protein
LKCFVQDVETKKGYALTRILIALPEKEQNPVINSKKIMEMYEMDANFSEKENVKMTLGHKGYQSSRESNKRQWMRKKELIEDIPRFSIEEAIRRAGL